MNIVADMSEKEKAPWYEVTGTKKGQIPVREEKRPKGKFVTVVFNIKGK